MKLGVVSFLLILSLGAKEEAYPLIRSLDLSSDVINAILKHEDADLYEKRLGEGCQKLLENDLVQFIEEDISPLFSTRPKFCESFEAKPVVEKTSVYFGSKDPNGESENLLLTIKSNKIMVAEHDFIENGNTNQKIEDLVINKILKENSVKEFSIPEPIEKQTEIDNQDERVIRYVEASRNKLSADPLLKQTLLSRFWPNLTPLEKMKIHRECEGVFLNNNKLFWEMEEQVKSSSSDSRNGFELAARICKARSAKELIPFLDRSLLVEYGLYLENSRSAPMKIYSLCEAWPKASLMEKVRLPSTTRERVLTQYLDFTTMNFSYTNGEAVVLFNNREDAKNLTDDEKKAIEIYTGDSYDVINAYEQWGYLGLIVATRGRQRRSAENLEEEYPMPNIDDYDDINEYATAYEKWSLNSRIGTIPSNWEEMTTKQKREYIEKKEVTFYEDDSGRDVPEIARNLKSALEKLDTFEGVSFGGHQLNSHIFTRLRKGGSFSPGFFMSTSTNSETAETFLKLPLGNDQNLVNEAKGYLFVVKNKSGVPLDNLSRFSGEYEVLMHPDAKYNVLDIQPFEKDGVTFPNVKVVYIEEK